MGGVWSIFSREGIVYSIENGRDNQPDDGWSGDERRDDATIRDEFILLFLRDKFTQLLI